MKLLSVVTISSLIFTLAACEGGSGRKTSGKQCAENHAPISMKLEKNQTEISLDPAAKQLVPGKYSYQGATAFYKEKVSKLMIEITDGKEKNTQNFKAVPTCVRNSKAGMNLVLSAPVIRTLEVGAAPDLKTFFETREITISYGNKLEAKATNGLNKIEDVPSKAYDKAVKPTTLMMVKKSDVDFEIRSHYTDGQSDFWVVTRLKRANLPAKKP